MEPAQEASNDCSDFWWIEKWKERGVKLKNLVNVLKQAQNQLQVLIPDWRVKVITTNWIDLDLENTKTG